MPDFLPRREAELLQWSNRFGQTLASDPERFGVDAQAAADYLALHEIFATRFATTHDRSTRTPVAIELKSVALAELKEEARALARVVRATRGMTNDRLIQLGLRPASEGRTAISAPAEAPSLHVTSVTGRRVRIRLFDKDAPTSAGRPRGVAGAMIFQHIGEHPPATADAWTWTANTGRTACDVEFPATLPPGTKIWLTAAWFNPSTRTGPASAAVFTHLGHATALPQSTLHAAA